MELISLPIEGIHSIEGVEIPENAVVVVLGKNWGDCRDGKSRLSAESKLNALAVYILDQLYNLECIIFSSGATNKYHDVSEARAMHDFVGFSGGSFNCQVCLEGDSHDTHSNADKVKKLLEKKGLKERPVIIVTIGYHCTRAEMIFRYHNYLNIANVLASEVILQKIIGNTRFFSEIVQPLIQSTKRPVLREALITITTVAIDHRGGFAGLFTRRRTKN